VGDEPGDPPATRSGREPDRCWRTFGGDGTDAARRIGRAAGRGRDGGALLRRGAAARARLRGGGAAGDRRALGAARGRRAPPPDAGGVAVSRTLARARGTALALVVLVALKCDGELEKERGAADGGAVVQARTPGEASAGRVVSTVDGEAITLEEVEEV